MKRSSRMPGFYRLSVAERRKATAEATGISPADLAEVLDRGGLDPESADKVIENVLGTYSLPFAVAPNVRVNGRDYIVPMAVEEPSVVAAASNAARIVREGGGFVAEADAPVMIAQVEVLGVRDPLAAAGRLVAAKAEIVALANQAAQTVVERGGGTRDLEVRDLGEGAIVVHLLVDCRDAMGANIVNTIAEWTAARIAEIAGGQAGLRILSNLADRRCVRVRASVPVAVLQTADLDGAMVMAGIVAASRFAERDPYRAATHNKGIMNGVDAVVIATGNDWRAVEAGAHAFAAQSGRYRPLSTWTATESGTLEGRLEMPMALGTVGGAARVHPGARLARRILGLDSASELACVVGAMGLASNLAALRALATEGIQRGHMALHARTVATAAGATGELVQRVANEIVEKGEITADAARRVLERLTP